MVAGAGSRVLGFVFGKAIAFTYAVIVSVVANVVFDLVRNPPCGIDGPDHGHRGKAHRG
jgi:hypothetical protein